MEIRKYHGTETDEQAVITLQLANAARHYYSGMDAIMSDSTYDKLEEKLTALEQKSGFAYDISPTVRIGYQAVTALKKTTHDAPALSLGKVKYGEREDLINWLNGKDGLLSWKLDGLTIVATYENGKLKMVATRGDGYEGSDVTHNAVHFKGLPSTIPFKGKVVVRGEAIMTYKEFERINDEADGEYENPRNLASSTVQSFDPAESSKREIRFFAFKLVEPAEAIADDFDISTEQTRFEFMKHMGMQVVKNESVNAENILEVVDKWKGFLSDNEFPTDGLVISYNDWEYAESLGSTGKYPRGSIALKWEDESKETTVRSVRFSVGKTGKITPVAIFDPVRLGVGSTVRRASLHNISVMEHLPKTNELEQTLPLRIGCKAQVALAQLIIPTVVSVEDGYEDVVIPDHCPVCGAPTYIADNNGVRVLYCSNPDCDARVRGMLDNAFGKYGLNVKGLGPAQIADLQEVGLAKRYPAEFFTLKERYGDRIPEQLRSLDGWEQKSWSNLLNALEKSRNTNLKRFLYSLGVPLLGDDLSKKLTSYWEGDVNRFIQFYENPNMEELAALDGIGQIKATNLVEWCKKTKEDEENNQMLRKLISELCIEMPEKTHSDAPGGLAGLTFVITGPVYQYANRDAFKASVEARGGKVSSSVSKKTSYLVCNSDSVSNEDSMSNKSKKARELGVLVLTEAEFIEKFGM